MKSTQLLTEIRGEQLENNLTGPVQTAEDVLQSPVDEPDGGMVFETSGRHGSAKRIPIADPDHGLTLIADVIELAGFEDHVALNFGAPLPHPTGWVFREAIKRLGGRAVNDHFNDFDTVLEDGSTDEITAMFGVPNVLRAVGTEIAETHGPPSELFPNIELIGTAGDLLTPGRREALLDIWDASAVRDMYGSSEFLGMASAIDDTNKQVPLVNKFIFELIPEDDPSSLVDIRDVTEERRGSLVVTDPAREAVDLTRYRIGDKVTIHPTGDLPRMTILGREDDSINLSGALLYPAQIHAAVDQVYGRNADWVAYVSAEEYPAIDFYIVDGDGDPDDFLDTLLERNGPVREAYRDVGVIDHLAVHETDSRESIPGVSVENDLKMQNVVFADSYADHHVA